MIIKPLGQSGYVLKTENSKIIIDPYLSDSVNRVAGRPRLLPIPINPSDISCDAVICTHDHLDHLDPDTVYSLIKSSFLSPQKAERKSWKALIKRTLLLFPKGRV